MTRMFMATLGTETNTNSPIPTGLRMFEDTMLFYGNATQHPAYYFSAPLHVWRKRAELRGWEITEGLCAYAEPGGLVPAATNRYLRDRLLADLATAMPFDAVLLNLHGAMIAEDEEDCEGALLEAVRRLVGSDVTIGVEIDLHCHLTPRMLANCDIAIAYKEYPHIDPPERAGELFDLVARTLAGEIRPVMAMCDCHMIAAGMRTTVEPMAGFVKYMKAMEQDPGILSVSFIHGFNHADVEHVGAKTLVVADNAYSLAEWKARALAEEIFSIREAVVPSYWPVEKAIDMALAEQGRLSVLADGADNPGIGGAGDSTFLLKALIARGVTNAAIGLLWDPVAVRLCDDAGEGARLRLRIGGKCGPDSGSPVDVVAEVKAIRRNHKQTFGETSNNVGTAVWVRLETGQDVVLSSVRVQTYHPDAFEGMGLHLLDKDVVVVKSSVHFLAGFAPIANGVVFVDSPGTAPADVLLRTYSKRRTPFWPRDKLEWHGFMSTDK